MLRSIMQLFSMIQTVKIQLFYNLSEYIMQLFSDRAVFHLKPQFFLPQTAQTDADPFSAQISEFRGKINYRITFVNTGALSFSTVT